MKNSSLLHSNPKLAIAKILNPTYPSPKNKPGTCRSARFSNNSEIFKNVEELKHKLSLKEKKLTNFTKKMAELQNLNQILISVAKKSSKNEELISQMDRTIESLKSSEKNLIEELEEQKLLLSELLTKFENYQEQGIQEKTMLRDYYNEYFQTKLEEENRRNLAKIRILEEENKILREKQNLKFYAEQQQFLREKETDSIFNQEEIFTQKKNSRYSEDQRLNVRANRHERKLLGERKNLTEFSGEETSDRNSKYDGEGKKLLTVKKKNSFVFLEENQNFLKKNESDFYDEENIFRKKKSLGVLEERNRVDFTNKENSKVYQDMIGKRNFECKRVEKPKSMNGGELFEEINKIKMDLKRLDRK